MLNFFEQQRLARKRNRVLIVLYVLGVLVVAASVTVVLFCAAIAFGGERGARRLAENGEAMWIGGVAAIFSFAIIFGSSFWRYLTLRTGGRAVAEGLSGRKIQSNTQDAAERRLLNVVEEMAIASSTPVPPVYVMDSEIAINAFAAGFGTSDAVIAVTRGALYRLNRQQMQGVIAHEFSHILGGDMRLNMRLLSLLYGVLAVAILGRLAFNGALRARMSGKNSGQARVILLLTAALLIGIGLTGAIVARLIKAAISRQCEYRADAAAVQFTRDPETIAGALKAIGGTISAGQIENAAAEECSHMFLVSPRSSWLESMLSTHPPLRERIRRLVPDWDGRWISTPDIPGPDGDTYNPVTGKREFIFGVAGAAAGLGTIELEPARSELPVPPAWEALSEADVFERLDNARRLLDSLERSLLGAARDPFDARALLLAMLLADDAGVLEKQQDIIRNALGGGVCGTACELKGPLATAGPEARLPLMDVAIGSLAALSPVQYAEFRIVVVKVSESDGKIDPFEWCVGRLMLANLDRRHEGAPPVRARYYAFSGLHAELQTLFSALAWAGAVDERKARAVLASATDSRKFGELTLLAEAELTDSRLNDAIAEIEAATPPIRRAVVGAAMRMIGRDGTVTPSEAELLRAIADSLGVPLASAFHG